MSVVGGRRGGPGEGPPCPANPTHGRLYSWEGGRWYCPAHSHGGNGKFFSDKEAHESYELTERDRDNMLQETARRVIAEQMTLDQAVAMIAKSTGRPTTAVRESLTLMVQAIQDKGESVAEKRKAAVAAKAAKSATPKATGRRLEHVEASEFQRVLKETGLTAKQAAEATGNAGMGKSATYVYILLHQGASANLFAKFEEALHAYADGLDEEVESGVDLDDVATG